ncbi:hypothetical protein BH23GEM4_BH23GEM4_04940 [soil metagenome]
MKRLPPLLILFLAAGCSRGPQVVVEARLDGSPVADLPVWILPYDREALMDSLTAAAETPPPDIPPALIERLRSLENAPAPVNPLPGASDSTGFAGDPLRLADSLRRARSEWAQAVYARLDTLAAERSGERPEFADTTDAAGRAALRVEPGRWWVYARYRLPDTELRWSVPLRLGTDGGAVTLERGNARVVPAL